MFEGLRIFFEDHYPRKCPFILAPFVVIGLFLLWIGVMIFITLGDLFGK